MFCSVLKNVSEVFAFGFGNRKTFKSFNAPRCNNAYPKSAGGLYVIDPTTIFNVTKAFGRLFLHLKPHKKASKTTSKSVNDSEEAINVFHSILMDEGYYSASTSKQFENTVSKLELCYDQLRSQFELKPHNKFGVNELTDDDEEENLKGKGGKSIVKETCLLEERVDEDYEKYFKGFINEIWPLEECINELTDDDEEECFKGKGKGGKRLIKKTCHLEKHVNDLIHDDDYEECLKGKRKGWRRFVKRKSHSKEKEQDLKLKEQYLSKLETKMNNLRFQELDEETQIMICKIDSLRVSGKDDSSIDTLLRMVEAKSLELQRYKKTVEKMKEAEADYTKTIDDILDEHQRILKEKNQEIANLKKKLQAGKRSSSFEGESSEKYEKEFLGNMRIKDLDDEYQTLITNIEALRKSDSSIRNKVLNKLGELSNIK